MSTLVTSPDRSGATKSLNNFSLFPLLPQELRLKIWRATLPKSPRIILVLGATKVRSAEKLVALYANKESRDEALRFYRPVQLPYEESWFGYEHPLGPWGPYFSIDNSLDLPYFDFPSQVNLWISYYTQTMQAAGFDKSTHRVAIEYNLQLSDPAAFKQRFMYVPEVQELVVVIHYHDDQHLSGKWRPRPGEHLGFRDLKEEHQHVTEGLRKYGHTVFERRQKGGWRIPNVRFVELYRNGKSCCSEFYEMYEPPKDGSV